MLLCGPTYRKDVHCTHYFKYRKLNLLGCDGVDKEARAGFCKPQSKSLFVCATKHTTHLLASIYRELVVT